MTGAVYNKIVADSPAVHDAVTGSIMKALAYFDIFQYPLTKNEIKQFAGIPLTDLLLERELEKLVAAEVIFFHHRFYCLHNNPLPACKRLQGNRRAEKLLPTACRIGRFLYRFPFVRGVGISGSLSKNFADEKADIDFFIVTKANRLWIARTLMHLYKKLTFLSGRQHYHCMNYYVDEKALLLEEKNIFTAIEIKTLLPVSGETSTDQFFAVNNWTNHLLPACEFRRQRQPDPGLLFFKQVTEWLLDNRLGNRIDDWLLRITTRRWKRKEKKGKRNEKGVMMGLRTNKHFARSNPGAFQEKVLGLYQQKLETLKL